MLFVLWCVSLYVYLYYYVLVAAKSKNMMCAFFAISCSFLCLPSHSTTHSLLPSYLLTVGTADISSIAQSTPHRLSDDQAYLNEERRNKRQAKLNNQNNQSKPNRNDQNKDHTDQKEEPTEESSIWGDAASPLKQNTKTGSSYYGAINDESTTLLPNGTQTQDDHKSDTDSTASLRNYIDPLFSWAFAPEHSNLSVGCLLVQSLPVVVIYPIRRIAIWFLVAVPWVYLMKLGWGRYWLFFWLLRFTLFIKVHLFLHMALMKIKGTLSESFYFMHVM